MNIPDEALGHLLKVVVTPKPDQSTVCGEPYVYISKAVTPPSIYDAGIYVAAPGKKASAQAYMVGGVASENKYLDFVWYYGEDESWTKISEESEPIVPNAAVCHKLKVVLSLVVSSFWVPYATVQYLLVNLQ